MAIRYDAATRNARMQIVLAALAGASVLQIGTAGMGLILAQLSLANPAGVLVGDVLTLTVPQIDISADATGIAAAAKVTNGGIDVITGLTVGGPGSDIVVPVTTFVLGQTVTLLSASITHS